MLLEHGADPNLALVDEAERRQKAKDYNLDWDKTPVTDGSSPLMVAAIELPVETRTTVMMLL